MDGTHMQGQVSLSGWTFPSKNPFQPLMLVGVFQAHPNL